MGRRPAAPFVIERNVAHLRRSAVTQLAGKLIGQVARQQQKVSGFLPQRRLIHGQPVAFGLGLELPQGFPLPHHCHRGGQPPGQPGDGIRATLVQPDNRRAYRLLVFIKTHHRSPLRGQCHRFNLMFECAVLLP